MTGLLPCLECSATAAELPGFFLALAPDTNLVRPGFLPRVLRFSLPAGVAAGLATFVGYEIVRASSATLDEARTAATIILLATGLSILLSISRPLLPWKVALVAAMGLAYVGVMLSASAREFFELAPPPTSMWWVIGLCAALGSAVVAMVPRFFVHPQE